ncbi:MAG TPA: LPS assembly lipoprotein LptE [Xanthobacteraceae bacterium]|jgi:LPS-assembly lipoprotein|nr:LPS assembly lipoprotein LptE [Xanthobacteraceae bacterium]
MWWPDRRAVLRGARLALTLGAAGLLAGCFEPLYGSHPSVGGESVRDKLADVQIGPIPTRQGTPQARLAVGMHNALQFDLSGGSGAPSMPTHRLVMTVGESGFTVLVDPVTGRPTSQVAGVQVAYQLVEIATGKVVLKDSTFANVDYDAPGSEQRFAIQRAQRDAEDRAVVTAADTIRNRLASYFVAGT